MPLSTQSTGYLITATDWNAIITYVNNFSAHKTDGQTLEAWGATAKTIGPSVGDYKFSGRTTDDGTAWLMCNGRTVGNGSSGGTARANADMSSIFIFLWTNFTNAVLAIQDSTGAASTRGASALADFNANKRMPLPDLRGRSLAAMDNMGGTSKNVNSNAQADINGGQSGTENHTLTTTEMPSHAHSGVESRNFWMTGSGGTDYASSSGTNLLNSRSTTLSAGSGGAHNNVPPTAFCSILIYTGL